MTTKRKRKRAPRPDFDAIAVARAYAKPSGRRQRRALDRAFDNAVARARRQHPEREPEPIAVLDAGELTVSDRALADALGIAIGGEDE